MLFEQKVAALYQQGRALNLASCLEVDEMIDPADTRRRIALSLLTIPWSGRSAGAR
jgi:acetyl-CoA carboxylase carboxyltransferase component